MTEFPLRQVDGQPIKPICLLFIPGECPQSSTLNVQLAAPKEKGAIAPFSIPIQFHFARRRLVDRCSNFDPDPGAHQRNSRSSDRREGRVRR